MNQGGGDEGPGRLPRQHPRGIARSCLPALSMRRPIGRPRSCRFGRVPPRPCFCKLRGRPALLTRTSTGHVRVLKDMGRLRAWRQESGDAAFLPRPVTWAKLGQPRSGTLATGLSRDTRPGSPMSRDVHVRMHQSQVRLLPPLAGVTYAQAPDRRCHMKLARRPSSHTSARQAPCAVRRAMTLNAASAGGTTPRVARGLRSVPPASRK